MPDLDPLLNLPTIYDPGVTRVVERHEKPSDARLLSGITRTSCSFVLLDGDSALIRRSADTSAFDQLQIRREFLVLTDGDRGEAMNTLRSELLGTGVTWQIFNRAMGGRASVLAEAVEYASNEFLVLGIGTEAVFDRIPMLLGHMWVEGADVGVLSAEQGDEMGEFYPEMPDASQRLTQWLGLVGSPQQGGLVVMRRWVARWLFNEISRSIDPADELADRARLLGLAILRLT
ncbi:MAG TPA: hypothetical protein VL068_02250 [Microthrixaceae bacterium]|nr:hypothetical protein [Microthrixaceae bacterium]